MPFDKRRILDRFFEGAQYMERDENNAGRLVLRKQKTSFSSHADNFKGGREDPNSSLYKSF